MTITQLKQLSDTNISVQTPGDKIQASEHRAVNNAIINELKDRGVLQVTATSQLSTISQNETCICFIPSVGRFYLKFSSTNIANGDFIFASATTDYYWVKEEDNVKNLGNFSNSIGSFNSEFVVEAFCYIRPVSVFAHGQPINWAISPETSDHAAAFITAAQGLGTQLRLIMPKVKKVLTSIIGHDESTGSKLIFIGPSQGLEFANFSLWQPGIAACKLVGNGTTSFSKSGNTSSSITFGNTGLGAGFFGLISSGMNVDYNLITMNYVGNKNYRLQTIYSGLNIYEIGFKLIDNETGLDVTTFDNGDVVVINNAGSVGISLNAGTFLNNHNEFFSEGSGLNFWYYGKFEALMVANKYSNTSIKIKWQSYQDATNYKIYRDTNANFTSQVEVYNGTNFEFIDTNLTSGTKYYYKMVAFYNGVNNDVTTFTTFLY